jgi:hypothetical protein
LKFLWIIAFCVALILSCTKYTGPNEKYTIQDILDDSPTVDIDRTVAPSDTIVYDHVGGITVTPIFGPSGSNWISPGKVFVSGIYPGGKAEYFVVIHNGKNKDSVFNIVARNADKLDVGYTKNVPSSWIYISNFSPLIKSGETIVVPIYVEIPVEYKLSYREKMEFLISVIDAGRPGNVIVELCSKWLITTR